MEMQSTGCTFSTVVTIDRQARGEKKKNNPDDALQGEFLRKEAAMRDSEGAE